MRALLRAFLLLAGVTTIVGGAAAYASHANNGSGDTETGRSFYPPVPDMRAALRQHGAGV